MMSFPQRAISLLILKTNIFQLGGSPGVGVMGGDSCSKSNGLESQRQILDGVFSHLFVVKIVMFV